MVENAQDTGSRMGEEVGGRISQTAQKARDAAVDYGRQGYQYAAEKGKQAKEYTEGYIQNNPWYAVGIVLGVGILLGMLLRSNRD